MVKFKTNDMIGKKIYGFKFDDSHECGYDSEMDKYIGKIGKITDFDHSFKAYEVEFEEESWWYPAELIEQHLIKDEIPELTDGVLMWVSNHESFEHKERRFVLGKKKGVIVAWDSAEEIENIDGYVSHWKYAKPIEDELKKVELTLDEIAEKFGVDVKDLKIKK